MKTYTIGRDTNSDIYIEDKMISRRHALLKVYPTGKMELVDMSTNGTFVNGIKLKTNSPMPLSRKDIVSFAHAASLDWNLVPNPLGWIKWIMIGVAVVVVVIATIAVTNSLIGGSNHNMDEEQYYQNCDQKVTGTTAASNGESAQTVNEGMDKSSDGGKSSISKAEKKDSVSSSKHDWVEKLKREELQKKKQQVDSTKRKADKANTKNNKKKEETNPKEEEPPYII